MTAVFAMGEYEEVKVPKRSYIYGKVLRLGVKHRTAHKKSFVAGPTSSEMQEAVAISLAAAANTTRLTKDFEPDWV